jgi:hypothetical protein
MKFMIPRLFFFAVKSLRQAAGGLLPHQAKPPGLLILH